MRGPASLRVRAPTGACRTVVVVLPPAFSLIVKRSPLRHVIRIDGEIDLATAPSLQRALEAAGAEGGDVTIDLTRTTFLDSYGLSVLLRAAERSRQGGHRFDVLCAQDGPTRRMFALTDTEFLLAA
jgi:anti-sigma B factor antagonist